MAHSSSLQLDQALTNKAFSSWRLEPDHHIQVTRHRLPGRVKTIPTASEGFLHTKTIIMHNHLHQQQGDAFVFLQDGQDLLALHRLEYDQAGGVSASQLTGPLNGKAEAEAAGGLLEPPLPASLAAVDCSSSASGSTGHLLVSSGYGDLVLVSPAGAAGHSTSRAICPLRATPPLQGVRPFMIEAAYESAGQLRCIVSVLRSKRADAPAACEIFAVTLQWPATGPAEPLRVNDVQLLRLAASKPHSVVVSPSQDMVLLAIDPNTPEPHTAVDGAAAAVETVEEFDADPRSLQQAVENLARFTSDQPEDRTSVSERLAEFEDEAGPEDEELLGTEPDVALLLLALGGPLAGGTPGSPGSSSAPREVDHIACGSHRLLGTGSARGAPMLLGLTDDVDAAAVVVSIGADGRIAVQHQASVPALAYVAAGKTQRRAVVFGKPGGDVAAIIVEAHSYAYVYRAVPANSQSGSTFLVPLWLSTDTLGVLGSSLLSASGSSQLVLLTEDSVILVSL